ncbi:collagen-binding domain-containing protein [Parafrankia discariae]|uniref:collagen-binding domain-containing protein n=1 Tax=Parafrankia discariae TaxID=365528 RepID=UPI0003A544EC|nr:collagen-binding domain-containing protein [Parafrankia discariae]
MKHSKTVGGDGQNYRVGLNNPGSYVLPGDSAPTSFVVGGQLDFAGSPAGGTVTVLGNSYAKVANLANATGLPQGGVTQVVPAGGGAGTTPALFINSSQPAASVAGTSGFNLPSMFATYRDLNSHIASCALTISLLDRNGQAPWNGTDPTATIPLRTGQNILNLTGAQLARSRNINPAPGSVQPSASTTLVVNVVAPGSYSFAVPNVSWQGNEPSRHVLWNFTATGTLTLPSGSNTVWGTIYAPNAALVDLSSSNIEGNVVVRTVQEGTFGGVNGGEIHSAPFSNLVTCAAAPAPAITVTKSVAQSSFSAAGQTLNYSYLVTNSGNTTLTGVVVNDARSGVSAVTCPVTILSAGASTTCTATDAI